MTSVSLQKCDDYIYETLVEKMAAGLKAAGFDPEGFRGKKVVLKPNILMISKPEKAVTTHPVFFRAAARVATDFGGIVTVAESPAVESFERAMKKIGFQETVEEFGLHVADVKDTDALLCQGSRRFQRFEIAKAYFDADIIVNLPKLKTHGITYMTGAVKNLFGTVSGLNKSRWHMKAPTQSEFADFLLDLNEALVLGFEKPKTFIHMMDAIMGLEGEGPGPTGTPRHIGAMLIGTDPVAVDYAAAQVLGFDPAKVRTVMEGFKRECWVSGPEQVRVVGESIKSLQVSNFAPSRNSFFSNMWRGPLQSKTVRNLFNEKPFPQEQKCTLCYQCMKICPAEAISKSDGIRKTPQYDYDKCIRCYCCMEICPEAAITLKPGLFQFLLPGTRRARRA